MRRIISFSLLLPGFVWAVAAAAAPRVNSNPMKIVSVQLDGAPAGGDLRLVLKWELAAGYHAYVEQFQIKSLKPEGAATRIEDIRRVQEFFDKTSNQKRQGVEGSGEIFARVQLPPAVRGGDLEGEIELTYQACAADHCLLPKTVRAAYEAKLGNDPSVTLLGLNVAINDWRIWLIVFLAGFLTSLTPCVFPLIPITLAVLGARAEHPTRRAGFLLSLTYVLGIATTYAVLGVVAALTGSLFGAFLGHPLVVAALAFLFLAMGLSMLGWFTIETPAFITQRLLLHKTQHGWIGAFLAGNIAGVVASPCVGPVLAALLTYVAQTQNALQGFALLFVFALGLGQLFLLLGTFSSLRHKLPRSGPWMNAIKFIFAASFFGLALFYMRPFLSFSNTVRIGALFLLLSLLTPERVKAWWHQKPAARVKSALFLLVIAAAGGAALFGWTNGGREPVTQAKTLESHWPAYTEAAVDQAARDGKPVIIDFFADWCVACKELDTKTFSNSAVKERLQGFVLLRFDATSTSPQFEVLQKRYEIVGLPHVVLLDKAGQWRKELTLTGFEGPAEFLRRIQPLAEGQINR